MKEHIAPGVTNPFLGDEWFDPLEDAVRCRIRQFIESMVEEELTTALEGRERYQRKEASKGKRNGHRDRQLIGSFGPVTVSLPRARVVDEKGHEREWRSETIPAYKRVTKQAEAIIAGAYLGGTNTRRVRRALASLFGGKISKDTVSRAWRKVQSDWEGWNQRDLSDEDIIRLILDGTVVKVRLGKKATIISLLVVLGVRRDGQKILLSIKNMGGESEEAWRSVLEDLVSRGMRAPELVSVDGGKGLETALERIWNGIDIQRCTVHKERNLLAHAPKRLHEEIKEDFNEMMYAETADEVLKKRKLFLAKRKLQCRGVADSLEKAGDRLFTFLRYPQVQWKSLRTTNAIERLHEEFKRRIKTQCVLPSAETAAMFFWALMASGQITMQRVNGYKTLHEQPVMLDMNRAA
uniref:Mutator family transposase n=1 Tax=Magnetococcus massalia (strain MO-1) TaxID=451514 RepID=A0A1S7LI18_MAGMO|nr:Transposase [Candidatus Magnetococcus massalia]